MGTLFATVYNRFLSKITDDMYLELTPEQTTRDLQNLLINAIPGFEFPRKKLDYEILERPINEFSSNVIGFVVRDAEGQGHEDASYFLVELDSEEVNILAILMLEGWMQRQVSSIEVTRMKYTGTDFKMTSQAAHLNKLLALLAEAQRQSLHMQRLYKRRKTVRGQIKSNWSSLQEVSAINGFSSIEEDDSDETKYIIWDGGIV